MRQALVRNSHCKYSLSPLRQTHTHAATYLALLVVSQIRRRIQAKGGVEQADGGAESFQTVSHRRSSAKPTANNRYPRTLRRRAANRSAIDMYSLQLHCVRFEENAAYDCLDSWTCCCCLSRKTDRGRICRGHKISQISKYPKFFQADFSLWRKAKVQVMKARINKQLNKCRRFFSFKFFQ